MTLDVSWLSDETWKKNIQRTSAYDVHYGHELAFSGDFPEQEGCT
jgi:hypothetical protein